MQDFEDFVALRPQALLRTAYLLCGDKGAAEDILQDVLMSMYGKWRRIRTSPEAYARALGCGLGTVKSQTSRGTGRAAGIRGGRDDRRTTTHASW